MKVAHVDHVGQLLPSQVRDVTELITSFFLREDEDRDALESEYTPAYESLGEAWSNLVVTLRVAMDHGERLWVLSFPESVSIPEHPVIPLDCFHDLSYPPRTDIDHRVEPIKFRRGRGHGVAQVSRAIRAQAKAARKLPPNHPSLHSRVWGLSPFDLVMRLLDYAHNLPQMWVSQLHSALEGVDSQYLPHDVIDRLTEAKIPVALRSKLSRFLLNPKTITYIVVLIYSTLRVLPVSLVKHFHGSLLVLWTIDILTAIPYTWGVLAVITAKHIRTRIAGLIIAGVTFIAPYIYFWMHGRHYPPIVNLVVTIMIVSGIGLEVYRYLRERALIRGLRMPHYGATSG